MLFATNKFPGDGSTTQYEFNFAGGYLSRDHVKAYQENNQTRIRTHVPVTPSMFLGPNTLRNLPVIPPTHTLVIYRATPALPAVDFTNNSRITEGNLDTSTRQGLFLAAEAHDRGDGENVEALLAAIEAVTDLVDEADASATESAASAALALTYRNNASASASASSASATTSANSATASGTSATASANSATAASNSAALALTRANAAGTEATNAGTFAGLASSHASNASSSAVAANTSANLSASTASTASTHASNASASATAAAGSATSASSSATTANSASNLAAVAASTAQLAVREALRQCCRLVRTGVALQVKLERFGGTSMRINNAIATIPEAGATVTLVNTGTLTHVYAYLNAGVVALTANTTSPVWHPASGEWVYPGLPDYLFVGAVVPNAMTQPGKFRSVFNGGSVTTRATGMTTVTGTWNGGSTILSTVTYIQMPGDTILLNGQTLWLNNYPGFCISDIVLRDSGALLMRERASLAQTMWGTASNNYVLLVPDTSIPYFSWSEVIFVATNNVGNTWAVEGGLGHHNVTCIPIK